MINTNVSLIQFLKDLVGRRGGLVLLLAIAFCIAMLLANIMVALGVLQPQIIIKDKWLVLWTLMPLILFLIHIRMRQLIESDGVLALTVHISVQFFIVVFLSLKNWNLL